MEVVGAVSGVLGVGQAVVLHRDALEKGIKLHREAIAQAERFHNQTMDFDLLSAMRENSRDIWAQKNNTTDTLMFSCGFAIIVEGMPPESSPAWVLDLFAFTVSAAICMLFLSTWLAMKLQMRMSKYNIFDVNGKYNCGNTHPDFKGYYHCHCRHITRWGYRLFYLGTFLLVACAALLLWERFDLIYHTTSAGIVFAAVGGATVIILIVLQIMLPAGTRQSTLVNSKSIQRELTRIMKESARRQQPPPPPSQQGQGTARPASMV